MSWIENVISFFTDRSKKLSTRTGIFIIAIFLGYLIDNITGLSYYYSKSRQIDQIESITNLLKDTTIDSKTRLYLISLRTETINRQTHINQLSSYIIRISPSNTKKSTIVNGNIIRSEFWFLMSTSGIYILVGILLTPLLLFFNKKDQFVKRIAYILMFDVVMTISAASFYWLFNTFMPNQIFGNWIWNYSINFIIQLLLIIGTWWASKKVGES